MKQKLLMTLLVAAFLVGCTSKSPNRARVEDRGLSHKTASAADKSGKLPPGFENAGKPGYYTVKPGDTLIRIGLDTGQNWRDITRWNQLEDPNNLEVGQVLRVVPPNATAPAVARTTPPVSAPTQPARASLAEENINWIWPAQGALIAGFDEAKNKGFDIAGKEGDPVVAAADGRVVYSGAGLRGYGNLIILKHNNLFLTAYAHNHTLLVKEDQSVQKGQKIAEMGSSDADKVKLHFEIRREGKPVDPAKYLPAR